MKRISCNDSLYLAFLGRGVVRNSFYVRSDLCSGQRYDMKIFNRKTLIKAAFFGLVSLVYITMFGLLLWAGVDLAMDVALPH